MSITHVKAIALTLMIYLILALAFYGWGKAFILAVRIRQKNIPQSFLVWTGWAFSLFLFQCIHFIMPINIYSVAPVLLVGIALYLCFYSRQKKEYSEVKQSSFVMAAASVAMMLLLILWVASRSMLPPTNYDSGLYHFNAIRWTNEYPLVLGLGNLHGRLAFNQSFFTYVAALNLYPLFGHGRSIANSFLFLLSIVTLFELILPIIKKPHYVHNMSPSHWVTSIFCLPLLAFWGLSSNGLPSPSPDLTCSLLQVIIFVIFTRLVSTYCNDGAISINEAMIVCLLAGTAITVKLSNVAFCAVVMVFALAGIFKTSHEHIKDMVRLLLPAVAVLSIFCLRGIMLSGAPLYPSTIAYISAGWSVPEENVLEQSYWVYSWARQPGAHWKEVLGSSTWFMPWLQKTILKITDVTYPLAVFILCGALIVFSRMCMRNNPRTPCRCHAIILLPLLASLAFWFFSAPNYRFANAVFLLLPISTAVLLLEQYQPHTKKTVFVIISGCVFVACSINLLIWSYTHRRTITRISVDGWHPVKQVALNVKVTRSGLRVYTPVQGDQCWDSPIPSTPYFKESLKLRDPAVIASGFTVSSNENKNMDGVKH